MIGGTTSVGVSLSGSAPSRYGAESQWLSATGRPCESRDVSGDRLTDIDEIEGDAFRYRVEVEGFGVSEYYEYDDDVSTDRVAGDWLADVRDCWGDELADLFDGKIMVTRLWTKNTTEHDTVESPTAVPPAQEETET